MKVSGNSDGYLDFTKDVKNCSERIPITKKEGLSSSVGNPTLSIDSGIDIGLGTFKEEIKKSIGSMIETKLNEFAEKMNYPKKTKPVQYEPTNERKNNLIIHGMIEENVFASDEEKLADLLQAIHVKCKPTAVFRLGMRQIDKERPLMVRLNSSEEKYEILKKLSLLKYSKRKYEEKISVTHDYTQEERKIIKRLVEEAKRMNVKEQNERGNQDYKWKVRGLQIVKISTSRA